MNPTGSPSLPEKDLDSQPSNRSAGLRGLGPVGHGIHIRGRGRRTEIHFQKQSREQGEILVFSRIHIKVHKRGIKNFRDIYCAF